MWREFTVYILKLEVPLQLHVLAGRLMAASIDWGRTIFRPRLCRTPDRSPQVGRTEATPSLVGISDFWLSHLLQLFFLVDECPRNATWRYICWCRKISEVRFCWLRIHVNISGPATIKFMHHKKQINKDRPTSIFQTYHNLNCPLLKYASNVLNVCRALDLKRCSDFVFLFFLEKGYSGRKS